VYQPASSSEVSFLKLPSPFLTCFDTALNICRELLSFDIQLFFVNSSLPKTSLPASVFTGAIFQNILATQERNGNQQGPSPPYRAGLGIGTIPNRILAEEQTMIPEAGFVPVTLTC